MSSSTHVAHTAPRLTSKFDDFKSQITQLKEEGFTHKQLLAWLLNHGIDCKLRTLERRLRLWGRSLTKYWCNTTLKITHLNAERAGHFCIKKDLEACSTRLGHSSSNCARSHPGNRRANPSRIPHHIGQRYVTSLEGLPSHVEQSQAGIVIARRKVCRAKPQAHWLTSERRERSAKKERSPLYARLKAWQMRDACVYLL